MFLRIFSTTALFVCALYDDGIRFVFEQKALNQLRTWAVRMPTGAEIECGTPRSEGSIITRVPILIQHSMHRGGAALHRGTGRRFDWLSDQLGRFDRSCM